MIKSLILTSLAFLTLGLGLDSSTAPVQDRCAQLGTTGYPLYCSPTGPDGPLWEGEVCCDGAKCIEHEGTSCPDRMTTYQCELAELDAEGGVTCLFEVENYCDTHACPTAPQGYQPQPQGNAMCCYDGACYDTLGDECGGILYWCDDGVTNESGTVSCFDSDTPETN